MMAKCPNIKWNTDSFRKRIKEISPNIDVVGVYSRLGDAIECHCLICNNTWFPETGNILRGTNCPECARVKMSSSHKGKTCVKRDWTNKSFVDKIREIDSTIKVLDKYTRSSAKVRCCCTKCGFEWSPTANNLLMGRSHCPNCSKKAVARKSGMSQAEFIKKVSAINDDVELIGKYTGSKNRITCRCKKCGNVWSPTGDSLLRGSSCRKCSYEVRGENHKRTHDKFISELSAINDNIIVLDEYKGVNEKMLCKCKICSYEWEATPHMLLHKRGCPNCAHTSTSYVEQFILQSFIWMLGKENVVSRDRSVIGKELDIFIPSYKFAIEPGSWKWHSRKYKTDIKKAITV